MFENNDQAKGVIERALTVLVTMFLGWVVSKGWLGPSDVAVLTPALVLLPSLIRGYMLNSNKSLVQSASAVVGDDGKKTLVAASPELAAATPETNIISNLSTKTISTTVDAATAEVKV